MTGRCAALLALLVPAATVAAELPPPVPSAAPSASPDPIDPVDRRTMQVHFLLASEHYKEGNFRAAIQEWNEVLKIQPDHALAREKIRKAKAKLSD